MKVEKGQVVTVVWKDCTGQDVMMTADEAMFQDLMVLHTTGNFVCETKEFVCVGQDWIPKEEMFRNLCWVPKINILTLKLWASGRTLKLRSKGR